MPHDSCQFLAVGYRCVALAGTFAVLCSITVCPPTYHSVCFFGCISLLFECTGENRGKGVGDAWVSFGDGVVDEVLVLTGFSASEVASEKSLDTKELASKEKSFSMRPRG